MRKFILLLCALFTICAFVTFPTLKTAGQSRRVVRAAVPIADQYIVVFADEYVGRGAVLPEIEAQAQFLTAVHGGTLKQAFSTALRGAVINMNRQQAEAMNQDPSVRSIEEDGQISVSADQLNAPWHLDRVDQRALPLNSAYSYTGNGAGVNVYVMDTGIRYTHTEFQGRADAVYDNINDGQNGNDCNGHGTHVAGIVGSATYGVAKNALLHSVRILPCGGSGQVSNLVMGVDWVTANRINPAVANISITAAGSSPALETAITNSIASGVTYAIAAGNSGLDACGYTPARTPNALTIGATLETDVRAGYSNYGPCIDLFAPGHYVTSLSNASDTDLRVLSGTSMASPMVAGAAALYLGSNPLASPAQVRNAIVSTATTGLITNIDGTSPNYLLYSLLSQTPPPSATPTPTPVPTPTPASMARVMIKKMVQNATGPASTVQFPYDAVNLASTSFALSGNSLYDDPNVPVTSGSTSVVVTETEIAGWRLASIVCTEVSTTGSPTVVNTTVDLANRRANILAETGEEVTCTFTSQPLAPTAAHVSVSGRALGSNGRGISNVVVTIQDAAGASRSAVTNRSGGYLFDQVEAGQSYIITGSRKRYQFPVRVISPNSDLTGIDLIAIE